MSRHTTALTIAEALSLLDPPMTMAQFVTMVALHGIEPCGSRKTGAPGRPPPEYDSAEIFAAHGEEARRTSKGFADADWVATSLLQRGHVHADPEKGELRWRDGSRAERLLTTHYGGVRIGRITVPAHRVIWIAAHGEIPAGIQINHVNRLKWDNRIANLELVRPLGNVRHAYGISYHSLAEAAEMLTDMDPASDQVDNMAALKRHGGVWRSRHARI